MICQLGTERRPAMDRLYSPICFFRLWGLSRLTEVVSYSAFVPCLLQGLVWGGYFGDIIQWTEIRDQDFPSGSPHTSLLAVLCLCKADFNKQVSTVPTGPHKQCYGLFLMRIIGEKRHFSTLH